MHSSCWNWRWRILLTTNQPSHTQQRLITTASTTTTNNNNKSSSSSRGSYLHRSRWGGGINAPGRAQKQRLLPRVGSVGGGGGRVFVGGGRCCPIWWQLARSRPTAPRHPQRRPRRRHCGLPCTHPHTPSHTVTHPQPTRMYVWSNHQTDAGVSCRRRAGIRVGQRTSMRHTRTRRPTCGSTSCSAM